MRHAFSQEVILAMKEYYTALYHKVGLKNIDEMVAWRLNEEDMEVDRLAKLEYVLNFNFGKGQKHLIIGSGTGGLAVELFKKGCEVYGIEPNIQANRIVRLKSEAINMPVERFTTDKAEFLPFADNSFDFIHCVSVIEHVDNVEKSLKEMIRVLNPKGTIYLSTANYIFPYERHYKIPFPTFLPKIFGYLYLWIRGRPCSFFQHLKFVNKMNIYRILYKSEYPLVWLRYTEQYSYLKDEVKYFYQRIWRYFTMVLGIQMNLELFIKKLPPKA